MTMHEAEEHLTVPTRDMHRAIASLMEELEAVDWYQQRIETLGAQTVTPDAVCVLDA